MTTDTAVLAFPGAQGLGRHVAAELGASLGSITHERFPDLESRVRVDGVAVSTAIVASLDRPDGKLVPLLLAADAARGAGAGSVGLIAPYLPYMRQDKRFHAGEALSAALLGRMLKLGFDWLVTLEPHLHRIRDLGEVMPMPAVAGSVTEELAAWVRANAAGAWCIGPDEESEQWVARVARAAGSDHAVFSKERHGDRDVSVRGPDLSAGTSRHAVLVDDILSSGHTVLEAARLLRRQGLEVVACLAVHAIFAEGAEEALSAASLRVVTCDGIAHRTNAIPVSSRLAALARPLLDPGGAA